MISVDAHHTGCALDKYAIMIARRFTSKSDRHVIHRQRCDRTVQYQLPLSGVRDGERVPAGGGYADVGIEKLQSLRTGDCQQAAAVRLERVCSLTRERNGLTAPDVG